MTITHRILPDTAHDGLADYITAGGGAGLRAARAAEPSDVIDELAAAGLRGRGGAGFPTATKWRTVRSFASPLLHTSVVVNAAEGEPGTFKDRAILRANPYAVLEGALIAAHVVDARSIVVATKAAFVTEIERVRAAIDEVRAAGWCDGVAIEVLEGPSAYLFGEETALLEVIDGRPPFPRIAPPFRRGVVEVVTSRADAAFPTGQAASVQMAELDEQSVAPPVLVNNVETLANVPGIVANGAEWFRSIGTESSPGSVVCTVTGAVQRPSVVEVSMGTTLEDLLLLAGGIPSGLAVRMVLVGVSGAIVTPDLLTTPLTYEAMAAIGSGLGSAGFIVVGTDVGVAGVAAGVSRFLAVESCGQCTPCKQDGTELSELLAKVADGNGEHVDLVQIRRRLGTVADGARCALASQQRDVVGSILDAFDGLVVARVAPGAPVEERYLVAPLLDVGADGAVLDLAVAHKNLDWTTGAVDSGRAPVDLRSPQRFAISVSPSETADERA
jgi:NADH:ubiquinone oxidoreductase subunit F (NADH-binding)